MEKKKKDCYKKFFCDKEMSDELDKIAIEKGGIYISAVIRIAIQKYLDQRREEQKNK